MTPITKNVNTHKLDATVKKYNNIYHSTIKITPVDVSDLKDEKIVETFYKKELQKMNKKEFRVENVIKGKGDKLYVKWKGCSSSFNNCIDKKYRG